jgi:hypothetical protein
MSGYLLGVLEPFVVFQEETCLQFKYRATPVAQVESPLVSGTQFVCAMRKIDVKIAHGNH